MCPSYSSAFTCRVSYCGAWLVSLRDLLELTRGVTRMSKFGTGMLVLEFFKIVSLKLLWIYLHLQYVYVYIYLNHLVGGTINIF